MPYVNPNPIEVSSTEELTNEIVRLLFSKSSISTDTSDLHKIFIDLIFDEA